MKTLKVSLAIGQLVRRDGFACRDEGQRAKPLGSRMAKVNALRELQSAAGEELDVLLSSRDGDDIRVGYMAGN
jgi:hypothetical protein